MFDASEILFLDYAVRLNFLTPNQRERLLGWQEQLGEDSGGVTDIVQEYALMDESEVQQVLQAIESGVSDFDDVPQPSVASTADLAPGEKPKPLSLSDLDDLLEEQSIVGDTDDSVAKELAAAVRNVLHDGNVPHPQESLAADYTEGDGDYEYEYEYEEEYEDEDAGPAFPMPGGGEAAYEQAPESEYAEGDFAEGEYEYEYEDEEAYSGPANFASSGDEIDGLLVDDEDADEEAGGGDTSRRSKTSIFGR